MSNLYNDQDPNLNPPLDQDDDTSTSYEGDYEIESTEGTVDQD